MMDFVCMCVCVCVRACVCEHAQFLERACDKLQVDWILSR